MQFTSVQMVGIIAGVVAACLALSRYLENLHRSKIDSELKQTVKNAMDILHEARREAREAGKVAIECREYAKDTNKIASKTLEMHDVSDPDGRPIWWNPAGITGTHEKIVASLETVMRIQERLTQSMGLLTDKVDKACNGKITGD